MASIKIHTNTTYYRRKCLSVIFIWTYACIFTGETRPCQNHHPIPLPEPPPRPERPFPPARSPFFRFDPPLGPERITNKIRTKPTSKPNNAPKVITSPILKLPQGQEKKQAAIAKAI
ncbi:unknown protein [Desulfotalea psychrophila LSv54]|uniref:Uncharacterized protein n=1 Tax=Desulfotalea psychrophila (strain LSv54 / DSM 12343) TaxID=177439 RepID=Q6AS71_DESPS|nr:unknown protein [Desulfotalea psychrophila LSv54]